MDIIARSPKIWTISSFLSTQECNQLILAGERNGFKEADVGLPGGAKMMKGIRDNYRAHLEDPDFAAQIWASLGPLAPTLDDGARAIGIYDKMRFYRYDVGQKFKRHIDGRVTHNGHESRLTFMVYLNDDYSGGDTLFNHVLIRPEQGMALLFIHEQKHESTPITAGTKYVLRSDVLYADG